MKIQPTLIDGPRFHRRLALIMVSSSFLTFMGCQSNPTMLVTNNSVQNPPLISTKEYQTKVLQDRVSYLTNFESSSGVNSDDQAKSALSNALTNHLKTPHISVTQTYLQDAPFIKKGSVDENSISAYKTIIEKAMKYSSNKSELAKPDYEYDDSDLMQDDYDYQNDYEDEYSKDSYEQDNYSDFEEDSYDDEYEIDENEDEYDEYYGDGDDDYYSDDEYGDDEYGYEEYESDEEDTQINDYQQIIDTIYQLYHRSPAQIEASNYYINQNMTINEISVFDPANKKINIVYSYDFASPTTLYSIQLPLSLDFNRSQLTLDPSAFLPIMALISPENAPIPEELDETIVAFEIPAEIKEKLPSDVIYDAFISAISNSLNELDSGNFTALDISKDTYAKRVGAHSAIKLNLDSKQTGKLIGLTLKHMSKSLQDYVSLRPDLYNNSDMISIALYNWEKANSKYQSSDIGSLFQLIEAVAPISFNQSNYYYLDGSGKLIAVQSSASIGGDILGATKTGLSQTTFNKREFDNHPLYKVYQQSFGKPFDVLPPASVDGNAWLNKIRERKQQLEQANVARSEYESDDALSGNVFKSMEDEDYRPSIRIIDYGNVDEYEDDNKYEKTIEK